jgi:hypothetical protein
VTRLVIPLQAAYRSGPDFPRNHSTTWRVFCVWKRAWSIALVSSRRGQHNGMLRSPSHTSLGLNCMPLDGRCHLFVRSLSHTHAPYAPQKNTPNTPSLRMTWNTRVATSSLAPTTTAATWPAARRRCVVALQATGSGELSISRATLTAHTRRNTHPLPPSVGWLSGTWEIRPRAAYDLQVKH